MLAAEPTKGAGSPSQPPSTPRRSVSRTRILVNVLLFLLTASWISRRSDRVVSSLRIMHTKYFCSGTSTIPNQVHFVKVVQDSGSCAEMALHFTDFLAMYSTWVRWRPHTIYLHTNAVDVTIENARDGFCGHWTKLALQIPNVVVLRVPLPNEAAGNGQHIAALGHKADFVAAEAVADLGGVYMAFDVFALRDMSEYRRGAGLVTHAPMPSGDRKFLMAPRRAATVDAYLHEMRSTYWNGSDSPTDAVLAEMSRRMVPDLTLLKEPAFVSSQQRAGMLDGLFKAADNKRGRHRLSRWGSRLDRAGCGDSGVDWRKTSLLHVPRPHEPKWTGSAFEHITPNHLLLGRSQFARHLYPVTKMLYEKGLIHWSENDALIES